MPSNVKLLAGASGGEPTDANFKNVTLLLHGDGSNGAQNNTFIDSSTNNFTITRNGNTTQGSFSPYGSNWSNYFDGNGDYISMPSNAAFAFGTGDYTIEGWFYPTVGGIDQRLTWFSDDRHNIDINTSNQIFLYDGSIRTFGTVNINSWNHFAVSRSGGTVSCYLNGVRGYNASETTNSTTRSMNIGANNVANGPFNGYISNMRVVKGTAVYSGSTITVPTAPLTAITNTSLLTCAYNRFRDGSTNNFTITRNGDVKVTNFAPFAPSSAYSTSANGGSGYFDGSGDYLSAPSNAALDCGTGDWTIECWTYISTRTNRYPVIFGNNRGSWTTDALALTNSNADSSPNWLDKFVFAWNNGGFISPSAGTSQLLVSNATNDLNTWYHFAVVRNGTSIKMYRNGVEVASATISSGASFNWGYNGALVGGGNWDGADSYYNGYISNLRLVKGTAVYTAAFTPPSSPVTAITNTSLLLNATNAAIFDNSMKNDLETVGNAQISTSVKKFGTGSIAFDGNGDYLYPVASPNLAMGTGDFTVEGWIYATGTPSDSPIFECRSTGSATDGFTLTAFSSSVIRVFCGSALISSSGTTYVNQWVHLAVVRSSGTTTFYINGTSVGSTTSTINWTNQDVIVGGGRYSAGSSINVSFTGYIDDFRITKGVARYTSNFTAPTAPFPNK